MTTMLAIYLTGVFTTALSSYVMDWEPQFKPLWHMLGGIFWPISIPFQLMMMVYQKVVE